MLIVRSLTRWPVPWPFESLMMLLLKNCDAEAATRSRGAMERCKRGGGDVAEVFYGHAHSYSDYSGVSQAGEIH